MHRTIGARLAVPLLTIVILVPAVRQAADAIDGCRPTPDGIECDFSGTSTTTVVRGGSLPPLRYLATSGGVCWYWSRYPPGLDSWNPANDQAIILTRLRLPECRERPTPPPVIVTSERAWEIFRAFPLERPVFSLTPSIGITNLPTRIRLEPSRRFTHRELLPDGRLLEVDALVVRVWIRWADGAPVQGLSARAAFGDPGSISHSYALKTCPADYRTEHLDGSKCHPTLDTYPVTITFEWRGRYRTGGPWQAIGTIDRAATIAYDVDEVIGVLVGP